MMHIVSLFLVGGGDFKANERTPNTARHGRACSPPLRSNVFGSEMKVAQAAEDGGGDPITLVRPVTVEQLGIALRRMPFRVIQELMELDVFVSLKTEVSDDQLLAYSKSANFDFVITGPK